MAYNARLCFRLSIVLFSSKHSRPRYTQLHGSSDALALAQYAAQHSPLAIIAANALEAQRLLEEIPFFAPDLRVHLLPDWETLPYDHFSPHQDLISERLATLHHIRSNACDVVIVPLTTALYTLPPVEHLAAYTFFLKRGEKLNVAQLREQMTFAGYNHVQKVLAPGEYCVRGGIIDLFAMGSVLPYRIDLFDDEIETIASFDVDTQRTLYPVPEIRLLPAREFPLDDAGQARFRQNFRDRFEGDPSKSFIYKGVSKGIAPAGIEYYLPLFFDKTATLFDYLPKHTTLCLHHEVDEAIATFAKDAASRYNLLRGDPQRPLLEPKELFLDAEQFFIRAKDFARIDIISSPLTPPNLPLSGEEPAFPPDKGGSRGGGVAVDSKNLTPCATSKLPDIAVNRRADIPTQAFQDFLQGYAGRVLLLADSLGRREIMAGYLHEYGLAPAVCEGYAEFLQRTEQFMLSVGPLQNGFITLGTPALQDGFAIVTETELYAAQPRSRAARAAKKSNVEGMLRDLSELKPGDPVVHEQHGIARYQGLVNLDLGEGENEFLLLEYAGNDKLYVPVAQLHVISRYSGGAADTAPLHKLGTQAWEKTTRRAMQQVRDTAAELLNLYAQRVTRKGHAFKLAPRDYEEFAAGFGFEETPDQAAAIEAVINDLQSGKPMDRLICGDVGFGKTEVALRAPLVAAVGGEQGAPRVSSPFL